MSENGNRRAGEKVIFLRCELDCKETLKAHIHSRGSISFTARNSRGTRQIEIYVTEKQVAKLRKALGRARK